MHVLGSRAIKCYNCQSGGSNCTEGARSCSASFDRCLRIFGKENGKIVGLARCATSDLCLEWKTKCNVTKDCLAAECCFSDLYNASPGETSPRSPGDTINCYDCTTDGSSCKESNLTCSAPFDCCLKGIGKNTVFKSCATSDICSQAKATCKANKNCEGADCCFSDLCNGSSGVLMVTAGALVFTPTVAFLISH